MIHITDSWCSTVVKLDWTEDNPPVFISQNGVPEDGDKARLCPADGEELSDWRLSSLRSAEDGVWQLLISPSVGLSIEQRSLNCFSFLC
ncbi:hypothetical protein VZT92_022460 [Zoarces viviparus]|uniref:Uncharacterized protein n=1 Tax=Zoarces viviparus TaxID=48416 RepID=A0AAW1EBG3_ZOAVI